MSTNLNSKQRRIERLTEHLPDGEWSMGCDCTARKRRRVIADRSGKEEVWACLRCFGLYERPSAGVDHKSAPQTMKHG